MRPFERDGDCYRTRLTDTERIVLGSAVADVSELLSAGADRGARLMDPGALDDRAVAPEDPAVLRLLPDASREDPEVSAEFRRFTEDDLRTTKIGRLERLRTALSARGDLVVPFPQAESVAAALTDVRLVVAERLGLETEEDAAELYADLDDPSAAPGHPSADGPDAEEDDELDGGAARIYLGTVYAALSWLQESLLEVMLEDMPR